MKRINDYISLKWVLFLSITFIPVQLQAQLIEDFKLFSRGFGEDPIELELSADYGIQTIKYLGKIVSLEGDTFRTFTSFINFNGKGVSRLFFISEEEEQYIYSVDLPEDLPIKIENTELIFEKGRLIFECPCPFICPPSYGCLERWTY
ncbi:MAG: hypothetical protein R3D00_21970 [Bacteroidia bacterium]